MSTEEKEPLVISDKTDSNHRSPVKGIYRFLGGTTLGIVALLIPATYGNLNSFGLVQVGFGFALIISCGLMSILWGEKFVDTVMRTLDSTGL